MAAAVARPLDRSQHHRDLSPAGQGARVIEMTGVEINGLVEIVRVQRLLHRRIESCAVGVLDPPWVSRNQRLPERHKSALPVGRTGDPPIDLGQRSVAIEPHGRDLRGSDSQ